MKKLIALFLMGLFVASSVQARNPHHKLTVVLENYVKKTEEGRTAHKNAVKKGLDLMIFHCHPTNQREPDFCLDGSNYFIVEKGVLGFRFDLNGVSYEALAEVMVDALRFYAIQSKK